MPTADTDLWLQEAVRERDRLIQQLGRIDRDTPYPVTFTPEDSPLAKKYASIQSQIDAISEQIFRASTDYLHQGVR